MINLRLLRQNYSEIAKKIHKKNPSYPTDELIARDTIVLSLSKELELLSEQSNNIAKIIKESGISDELKNKGKDIKIAIDAKKKDYEEALKNFNNLYLLCPNIPDDDIPIGNKNENKVIKTFGSIKKTNHELLPYYNLKNSENNHPVISGEMGAEVAKSGFSFYFGSIAKIIHRLTNLFLTHNESKGFIPVIPPTLINETALTAASNLPIFRDDVFFCEEDKLFLIPTAEVCLAYLHHDTILQKESLPLRYTALTNCFRREAGGYGANERGIMRMHEFHKVEIFSFCTEELAAQEHELMLNCAEELLQMLDLHYQVSLLAAQDCSFASKRTYDIEIFFPGSKIYKEVSSVSNCGDFQSRRSKTRCKGKNDKESNLVYTLNGSSLAIPRVLIALMETHQSDGEINFKEIEKAIEKAELLVKKNSNTPL